MSLTRASSRCAPKQIATELAGYLKDLGYDVSKTTRHFHHSFGHEIYTFTLFGSGDAFERPSVHVHFDPKPCAVRVTPVIDAALAVLGPNRAREHAEDLALAREIERIISRL